MVPHGPCSTRVGRRRAAALALALAACGEPAEPQEGVCQAVVWGRAQRQGEALAIVGSWDDWSGATVMQRFADDPGWQLARLDLPPGVYGYLVVEEGAGRVDAYNGLTTFREGDGQEVSRLHVPDCEVPRATVIDSERVDPRAIDLRVRLSPARGGDPIDPQSLVTTAFAGVATVLQDDEPSDDMATVRVRVDEPGKQTLSLSFRDPANATTAPLQVSAWGDAAAETWTDGIVYQVVVDRFADDEGPLSPPPTPGFRAGGTLGGVTAALRDGQFAALGVSALWLSPVYVNPAEARAGRDDDHLYEGYHGYWPVDSRAVDPRLGGEAALRELVAEAHAQGVRVLLDLVPNHLYETNPRVATGRSEGWFHEHDEPCVCGTPSCPWSSFIRTCWFTDYLPDLRFENPDVMEMVVADAVWWHEEFGTDGFRIDAVPMMPRATTRRIAHALRQATAPRDSAFTIGEIFTGAGRGGTEDLRYYLGPDGLDSAFDFPLMWALRSAIAHDGGSFEDIEDTLAYTDAVLAGSGAEMQLGRMIGNHDVTRFASESAGDAGLDGWTDPPPQALAADVYERQRLALGLVLTLPGLPVLYYGDEIALAGAADPDNRRVMPDEVELSDAQRQLRESVRRIGTLRRCSEALRRGTRRGLVADDDTYAFARQMEAGSSVLVVVSSADVETALALRLDGVLAAGSYVDALEGDTLDVAGGETEVRMPPRAIKIFVPAGDPCL